MNDIKAKPGAPEPAGFEFFIRREFDAPLDRMWRAWSDPERMSHWWGPKGSKTEVVKLDFRPGGICHYRMDFEGQTMWGAGCPMRRPIQSARCSRSGATQ